VKEDRTRCRGRAIPADRRARLGISILDYAERMTSRDLTSTYLCLAPHGKVSAIPITPEFWATVGERDELRDGRLVAVYASSADWPHWEMHPHGDEVLILLSGSMTMVFEKRGGKEEMVELQEGHASIVPRGTWHRAIVRAPSKLLAITYGRETEHRAR
jgi:mannose-6-phosphate isomerase-like protein (cupin superfamily)